MLFNFMKCIVLWLVVLVKGGGGGSPQYIFRNFSVFTTILITFRRYIWSYKFWYFMVKAGFSPKNILEILVSSPQHLCVFTHDPDRIYEIDLIIQMLTLYSSWTALKRYNILVFSYLFQINNWKQSLVVQSRLYPEWFTLLAVSNKYLP